MSDGPISFETLNAYVDGELDAAAAAEVARAVADDPALARQVAALSRLRSAVAEGVEAPPLSVPTPQSRGRGIAIAAGIALALFVAGSLLVSGFNRKPGADWRARAWQLHQGWSLEEAARQTGSSLLVAGSAEGVPGTYVPDLSAARLSIVHVAVKPFPRGRRALLVGYRGTRGCKISLIAFPSPDAMGETLTPLRKGKNEAYAWQAGGLGYVIMSEGMDSTRFRLLAESVRHTSRQHLPFDKETQMVLRKSRDESEPCFT
ncbi:MAG: hypothetical protein ACE5GS_13655 [Kiloniellaceae bacterium]